jgi:ubiquinone/menaquinone biosynthesis C-methylase UbiE
VVAHLLDLLALPAGARIADVGAGTGNYSAALAAAGYPVIAIDPSPLMLAQAVGAEGLERLLGVAQALPLRDRSVEAVVSTMTLQHLRPHIGAAAREMHRVAGGGPAVLLVVDPREAERFWFADYFPVIRARMFDSYAPLNEIEAQFRAAGYGSFEVLSFPLPRDFSDMNMHSGWGRPEIYLDAGFRQNMSPFALASASEVSEGVERLRRDLESGAWDAANGALREQESFDLGFRFLRAG